MLTTTNTATAIEGDWLPGNVPAMTTDTPPVVEQRDETREAWLVRAADIFQRTVFGGRELIPFRVSCGFPAGRGRAIGQCWYPGGSADGHCELFISPELGDALPDAERVNGALDVLLHEMVHVAAFGWHAHTGHGKEFKKLAGEVGLGVTPRGRGHTFPSEPLLVLLREIVEQLGPYPHATLQGMSTGTKKQTTRMVKCACECGIVYRTTRTHLEAVDFTPRCINPECEGEVTVG